MGLTTKHFPGGGPQVEGQDPHFDWGKDQHYPGDMFDYHLKPFKAAIDAGTSAIMPYYSKPIGTKYEEVAFAYNKAIIKDLLRDKMGFQGIINSDTGPIEMMPWGVEKLIYSGAIPESHRLRSRSIFRLRRPNPFAGNGKKRAGIGETNQRIHRPFAAREICVGPV